MENEIWKDIVGYEGLYQVSNLGRVRKIEPKILGQGGRKYKSVWLTKGNKQKYHSVHRLVAQAFIPNPLNKETVNHINGIKTDNRVENLEWATYSENIKHGFQNNLIKKTTKWKRILKIKDGKILKEYRSILQASKDNNISYTRLRKTVYSSNNKYKDFEWELLE